MRFVTVTSHYHCLDETTFIGPELTGVANDSRLHHPTLNRSAKDSTRDALKSSLSFVSQGDNSLLVSPYLDPLDTHKHRVSTEDLTRTA
jgi:hypothetical protein